MKIDKLDEIIDICKADGSYEELCSLDNFAKKVALEFARHILEEAAENAKMDAPDKYGRCLKSVCYTEEGGDIIVNAKSITDTLNKYL